MKISLFCEFCQEIATMICVRPDMHYLGPKDGLERPILYPLCPKHYWKDYKAYEILFDEDE